MKDFVYGILLLIIGIIIGVVLNLKFNINFGLDKILGNGITSGFQNSIKTPSNIMKETGNMMGF